MPQIVDVVTVPVIAAGGLFDHRTIIAVFPPGAEESAASEGYKEFLLHSNDTSTELTRAFSGKWARGIGNSFMEEMNNSSLNIPYYTYQNSLTAALREYGKTNEINDIIFMWAGQSASQSKRSSTENLFRELIAQIKNQSNPIF